ncbi:hypothetical protein [Bifidobacterium callitrichos]|uniref:hypothetical protein n=1 Tax=Bifidobacterium callitrichos TaxID=762209 RepID=UPI000A7CDB53|nr:hypothetical protein [Bifidobacterium callitrichos]
MFKKLVSWVLCIVVMMTVCPLASAEDNDLLQHDTVASSLRYGESEKTTILNSEYKYYTVTPANQGSGFNFPGGGSIIVNPTGGPTVTASFSVSWGVVSTGVSVGYVATGLRGITINVPADNHYYIARLKKKYLIQRVRHDYYEYGVYKYSTTLNHSTYINCSGFVQRVK